MKIDEKLSEKFNIEPEESRAQVPAVIPPAPVPAVVADASEHLDTDTEKARTAISSLIDKSMNTLDQLIRIAQDSESPRAYEVVAAMIKTTADISKDLLEIQKRRADLRPSDEEPAQKTNIGTQNIFVGSTNDLLRAIATAQGKNPGALEIPANAEIRTS